MASIRKEILLEASAREVWDAVCDVGALHERLVPGFVLDTRLEDGARIVTFGNGLVVRELIVDLDDQARRLVWSARGGRLTHHNASVQVFDEGDGRARLVWIADLLPDALAGDIRAMIEQGAAVMKKTLERRRRLRRAPIASSASRSAPALSTPAARTTPRPALRPRAGEPAGGGAEGLSAAAARGT